MLVLYASMLDENGHFLEDEQSLSSLKNLREYLGMTQEEFCREVGITAGSLSRCERGLTELLLNIRQIKRLHGLLQRYGLDFQDLPDSLKSFKR